MVILPTEKTIAKTGNPRVMLLFGKPKCGKTSFVASLENNLIIDLEDGTAFVNALVIPAKSISDLVDIAKAIKEKIKETNIKPYKYITIDTGTILQELAVGYALKLYQKTPMARRKDGTLFNDDVRKLPSGGGYLYLRQAFVELYQMFIGLSECLIIICHSKLQSYEEDGIEISEIDIDLTPGCRGLLNRDCDTIGYIFRKKNQTIISFKAGKNIVAGTRPTHLNEKEIVVAESNEDGIPTFYPDRIFLPDNSNINN